MDSFRQSAAPAARAPEVRSRTELVFALLEYRLREASLDLRELQPIIFVVIGGAPGSWYFDPRRSPSFRPGHIERAALRIVCSEDTLFRLVTDSSFACEPGDVFHCDGDFEHFARLLAPPTKTFKPFQRGTP